jgi:hypothetical protein
MMAVDAEMSCNVATCCVEQPKAKGCNSGSDFVTGTLCSPFCLSVFFALSPHELASLEATCRSFQNALHGEFASSIWAASAFAAAQRRRLLLPLRQLAEMPVPALKSTLGHLRLARGPLNDNLVQLPGADTLRTLSHACSQAVDSMEPDTEARVIVGRLKFHQDELEFVATETTSEDEGDEDLLCFSNPVGFWMPGATADKRGATLVASLGCRQGVNALEVSSVIKPLVQSMTLCIDVRLLVPGLPQPLIAESIEVDVDGDCGCFDIPGLDITDEQTRQVLTSDDGVLCIFSVRSLEPTAAPPAQQRFGVEPSLLHEVGVGVYSKCKLSGDPDVNGTVLSSAVGA